MQSYRVTVSLSIQRELHGRLAHCQLFLPDNRRILIVSSTLTKEWSNGMAHSVNRFSLTPREAAAKALIVEQLRTNPRGPWVNGKKTVLPAPRDTTTHSNKKK